MANIKISELNPLITVQDADVLPIVDNAITKKVTAEILRNYTQGNSVLLTGAQTIAGIKTFTSQLASTVATGTAPFSVASTTKVTNLNADLLDGLSSADFQATLSGTGIVKSTAGTISYLTDNTANWDSAYNDKINSASVTGSGTNTLTLTQQDAGTITATWVNGTLIREVRNSTGATLTKGTIVYISGATGNKPTVSKAIATGDSTSAQTFGFIQTDIANNANGYVVAFGDLTGIDTSAFTEGDQLYLSSTTAGTFTATKQYAPNHLVYVGIVTRSHPTLGQIEVNIQNGYEMDELHNVSAQNPSNGDILQFVTSTGLWTKVSGTTSNISEGTNLYFTDARSRSAISLTTTGTSGASTYNSTTGVLNIPQYQSVLTNPITGTGTTNYLPKFTGASALGNSSVFDNGTNVGIGTITPVTKLDVKGNVADTAVIGGITVEQTSLLRPSNDVGGLRTGFNTTSGNAYVWSSTSGASLNFGTRVSPNNNIGMTLLSSGNFGIGTTAPASKLEVQVATAGTSVIGFFNNTDFTAANKSAIRVRQQTGASTGFSAYLGMDGNTLFLSNDTTATNHLAISTTGAATFSSNLTAGLSSATGAQLTLNALYANGINFINTNVAVDNRNFRIITDQGVYGTFNIQKSTTQGGSTYANLLSFDQNSAATFVGTVTAAAGLNNTGSASDTWAANSTEGLAIKGSAFSGAISTISTSLDNTAIRIGAGGSQKTGILINGQTTGAGSSVLVSTGGATRLTIGATGIATFTVDSIINGLTVGRGAGSIATNTAVGFEAINSNVSGTDNTSIGYRTLKANTGSNNTAVGSIALTANTSGNNNTAVGLESLTANTTGAQNTALGQGSSKSMTTGANNTSVGRSSLFSNTIASNNVAVGVSALLLNTAANNTAVGFESAYSNTSGVEITAVGYRALKSSTGNYNTALGTNALTANTTGVSNTGIGRQALASNISGSNNVSVGADSLLLNTASNNTAVGFEAANANTSGSVTAIGYQALKGNTTGANNTALGNSAMSANTTGNNNVAIGGLAMQSGTASSNAIAIGYDAQAAGFSGGVTIGRSATATANNQFVIGSSVYPAGAVATETVVSDATWSVRINGVAYKILLKA